MTNEDIIKLLNGLQHPETGKDIVSEGILKKVTVNEDSVVIMLSFPRQRDPFASSIKREIIRILNQAYPTTQGKVTIYMEEAPVKEVSPKQAPVAKPKGIMGSAKYVVAIASGKGGVGKSTVAANLAVTLAKMGYRVGLLDADIYGPSQPSMFGMKNFQPDLQKVDGVDCMIPAEKFGVKLMSIGFFINEGDALVWRGPMATNALNQLIHQTLWGDLDFLLIDLPPGTGDVHLTIIHEFTVSGALIVSTPQDIALADVLRGIRMFTTPKIEIPILGIVENMAWFTPEELPDNKYYIFGNGGAKELAGKEGHRFLGDIPIIMSVMSGGELGVPAAVENPAIAKYYIAVAEGIVSELKKR